MGTTSTTSDRVLARLTRLHPKIIDLSLDRVHRLLARVGNPHDNLPPVVHVAGTNGKGSVIAFMRAALEAAGYRVHVFTSPHLVRFNERIRLAGDLIAEDALLAVLEECEAANGDEPITFFEITTVAAFLAFTRTPADVLLLETGLGGRLDATNVVDRPALTAITSISLDHEQYLGSDLAGIAREKAGIMRAGVPCLAASQERKVDRALKAAADKAGAPLVREGADWHVQVHGDHLSFRAGGATRDLPLPRLVGKHQARNAGLAVACLDRLTGFTVPDGALGLGLRTADWPARLQRLDAGALAARLPAGWQLWLDGGHNGAAAKVIANQARHWRDMPLHMVFGLLNTKDPAAFLKPLAGRVGALRTVTIPGEPAARPAEDLARVAAGLLFDAAPAAGVEAALDQIAAAAPGPARVLICGSLYLAGSVLALNGAGAPA
ncbi:MAG: bifunctional folylpolyglutamate synthase/dihydrofolate synthase [Hyphomicrobiales bacterium]|nr:bifunctional folylpolyglutamate synthase/dihydrofolate synthase [Hyphomicrobiales bacterium]MCP5370320.1 bifunctional folylpolyglutamate synthase/dihydrofolate synthase [Hyphomicrobiales bacterium]